MSGIARKLMGVTKGAPIEYVGSAKYQVSATTQVVYGSNAIAGLQEGDLLVVFISSDTSDIFNSPSPSGWSVAYHQSGFTGTSHASCFYKAALSASDTGVTFVDSTGAGALASVMVAFRNANFSSASLSTLTTNPPSSLCAAGDCAVINLHYQDAASIASITPPSGYTTADHAYIQATAISGNWTGYKLNLDGPSEDPASIGGAPTPPDTMGAATVILSRL